MPAPARPEWETYRYVEGPPVRKYLPAPPRHHSPPRRYEEERERERERERIVIEDRRRNQEYYYR